MQLKKQAIRKMPNYDKISAPHGIKRNNADYNQVNNLQQRNRNKRGDSFKLEDTV